MQQRCIPGLLSWAVTVIRNSKFKASDVFPNPGSNIRHPFRFCLPSTGSSGTSSPASSVLCGATTSCCPSRRTSFPSLGDTSDALVAFAPRRTSAPPRPGVDNPVSPSGCCRGSNRISQVPGEPRLSVCTCSNPTPAGLLAPDHYGAAAWPLVFQKQRLPRKVFRSSIAWLSDSLSTLRRVRCLPRRKTRFQLLVRLYWTGFPPARFR